MKEPKPVTWESFAAAAIDAQAYYTADAIRKEWIALHGHDLQAGEIDEDPS